MVIILGTGAAMAAALASPSTGKTKDPTLKPVPKVVKVKSTKIPPKNVKFRGEPMPGGITSGTGTAAGGAGEVIIPGVPAYDWTDGCGPTALGMVVGYWDGNGWGDLIPGDATTDTPEVYQSISSHGSAEAPKSYEDYALPAETSATILPDRSEAPAGDEHASDCLADFMQTSWSVRRLAYGWSFSNMIGPAFTGYVHLKYPASSPAVTTYGGSTLTWTLFTQEMDAGRPMVLLVDSDGDGMTDHFVTAVGYREVNGYPEYGCWDTWDQSLLRWQQFRGASASYAWGIWGGFTLRIDAGGPSQSPTPTPTPTPTSPPADTTAPATTQQGGDVWHKSSATVTFTASDSESGVAYTEYAVNSGAWTRGTQVSFTVPRKSLTTSTYTLSYRSVDVAGNIEAAKSCKVLLDAVKPLTGSNADGQSHSGSFTVALSPSDPQSGVAATYYSVDGRKFASGTSFTVTGKGRHTVKFYSVDNVGNTETTKSATVTIS